MQTLIPDSLSQRGIYGQAWLDSGAHRAQSDITVSAARFCPSAGRLLSCHRALSWAASVTLLTSETQLPPVASFKNVPGLRSQIEPTCDVAHGRPRGWNLVV